MLSHSAFSAAYFVLASQGAGVDFVGVLALAPLLVSLTMTPLVNAVHFEQQHEVCVAVCVCDRLKGDWCRAATILYSLHTTSHNNTQRQEQYHERCQPCHHAQLRVHYTGPCKHHPPLWHWLCLRHRGRPLPSGGCRGACA